MNFRPAVVLAVLSLFAAIIRFYHISHPCLWYDESMVFWRTCGTYGQLLDCLRTDGFVPLHYSLIWLLAQRFHETPAMLRFVPALCGTLMVPAIYFLARQLLNVQTALLAAAFAACSAFLLFYSRDAKMYMDAWLFVTLNMGCLLWWFREKTSTAWLCWIASGCAACGLHFSSAVPVLVSLLLLFSQSKMTWQQTLLWLVGIALIFAGPIGYYEKFNRWEDRVDEDGWKDSGLQWIGAYNAGRTGPELVRVLGTSTLMGWEWPKDLDVQSIQAGRVNWPERGAQTLMVILIAGCYGGRRFFANAGSEVLRRAGLLGKPDPALRSTSETGVNWQKGLNDEPRWRVALWLAFWIVLPVYGFYCRSMPGFSTPVDWWHGFSAKEHWFISALVLLLVAVQIYRNAGVLFSATIIVGLCWIISVVMTAQAKAAMEANNPWQSLWVPRYIAFIWPALALAVAALVMRLPTRPLRAVVIFFILGLNLSIAAYRVFGQTEPPVDLMAADTIAAENLGNHTQTWMHIKRGMQYPGGGNLFSGPGEYYLDLLRNQPTSPPEFRKAIRLHSRPNFTTPMMLWRRGVPSDVTHVIIWDQFDSTQNPVVADPPPGWKLESESWFDTRDCWIWQDLSRYRRQVYDR